jgi:pimeloyl-ACP methyl ester carboxylesterase
MKRAAAIALLFVTASLFAEEGMVDGADGVRLHYSKIGSGKTVLIIPAELFLFDDFKQLADQATVIAYDMRNRGRSARTPLDKVSIQADVRDLEAVRRHFNVDRFVPVGFSYLGLMVALYALDHPERVERMIQMGPISMVANTEYPKELTHGDDDVAAPDAVVKQWREMRAAGTLSCEVDAKVMQYVLASWLEAPGVVFPAIREFLRGGWGTAVSVSGSRWR